MTLTTCSTFFRIGSYLFFFLFHSTYSLFIFFSASDEMLFVILIFIFGFTIRRRLRAQALPCSYSVYLIYLFFFRVLFLLLRIINYKFAKNKHILAIHFDFMVIFFSSLLLSVSRMDVPCFQ